MTFFAFLCWKLHTQVRTRSRLINSDKLIIMTNHQNFVKQKVNCNSLGLLTCKNRLPYNLYCVGGDEKHCSINQSVTAFPTLMHYYLNDSYGTFFNLHLKSIKVQDQGWAWLANALELI